MDIQMPVMDGVEATKKIRNDLKISTPIVALTANAFKHDIDLYLSIGMDDFLIKPYKEAELYSKIDIYRKNKHHSEIKVNRIHPTTENSKKTAIESTLLFSLKQLKVIANGDEKFIATMIGMFQTLAQATIDQLRSALETNDIESIKRLAHKLKPSLDNLEINILYNEIRTLEHFNEQTGCPENLRKTVEFVIDTLTQVNAQLSTH
jgi:CheY-like chemotaxis protein